MSPDTALLLKWIQKGWALTLRTCDGKGILDRSVDISNPESHKMYIAETRSALRKYGARFVIRGGKSEVVEGKGRSRIVVIEFKHYATALECYPSTPGLLIRKDSAVADIISAEGYNGAQPTDE